MQVSYYMLKLYTNLLLPDILSGRKWKLSFCQDLKVLSLHEEDGDEISVHIGSSKAVVHHAIPVTNLKCLIFYERKVYFPEIQLV